MQAGVVPSDFDFMFSCDFPSALVLHGSSYYPGLSYENGFVIIFSIPLFSCHFIVNFRLAMTIEAFSRGKVQDVGNWIKH